MNTFVKRTLSGAVYAMLFVGSIYSGRLLNNAMWGVAILLAFLLFVTVGCTFEFFRIVAMQGAKPCKPLGYLYAIVVLLGLGVWGFPQPIDFDSENLGNILLTAVMLLQLPIAFAVAVVVQLWRSSEQPFRDAAYTLVPMVYVALPLGLMPWLHTECNVLMMCIILIWVNDSFAYMGGSLLGKHKMWEHHSKGKTWEGTVIGALCCMAVAIGFGPMFSMNWVYWAVIGIICSVVGTLGDLVESMLKRSVGLKDSGNIMPGHGGFLDRFDSLLIVLPFVALYSFIVCIIGY